jgi:multiple sugar transport system ATP-binding protein
MGRAIVREPQVFLMDEPLSNLDAKLRVQTRAQIAALQQRLGVTTVYVTHDQVEAMTMGDRVAVLLDGVLQQVDGPRALYDRPANAFVAGFIGSPAMNLRTVRLTDSGADFGGMPLVLTREQVAAARADGGGNRVTIGFRPEHTELVSDPTGAVPMVVELVEELGSDAYVHGHAKLNGEDGSKDTLVVRTDGRTVPRMGETVYLRPREGAHHAFNAETGIRV